MQEESETFKIFSGIKLERLGSKTKIDMVEESIIQVNHLGKVLISKMYYQAFICEHEFNT